jgi:hypothetical protein
MRLRIELQRLVFWYLGFKKAPAIAGAFLRFVGVFAGGFGKTACFCVVFLW